MTTQEPFFFYKPEVSYLYLHVIIMYCLLLLVDVILECVVVSIIKIFFHPIVINYNYKYLNYVLRNLNVTM